MLLRLFVNVLPVTQKHLLPAEGQTSLACDEGFLPLVAWFARVFGQEVVSFKSKEFPPPSHTVQPADSGLTCRHAGLHHPASADTLRQ